MKCIDGVLVHKKQHYQDAQGSFLSENPVQDLEAGSLAMLDRSSHRTRSAVIMPHDRSLQKLCNRCILMLTM
eukprot:SAG31_NODE_34_length_31842_cov_31.677850_4_plen_72_part_00